MSVTRIPQLEADLAALRDAAERAGKALACVFHSAAEFEAAEIAERRARGAYASRGIAAFRCILVATIVGSGLALAALAL